MRASQLLKQERATLVAMLERLAADQWSAATLCAGWDVTDVVAHLLAREERPFGFVAGKLTGGWLGPHPDDLAEQIRARGPLALLRGLRAGPPLVHGLPGPAAQINMVENWVH
ncbi:MAG TPA: maleylpyruvate isomerase family mycothiol-dependent enzyme, partial [Herpetosiphonaceae bacterium]